MAVDFFNFLILNISLLFYFTKHMNNQEKDKQKHFERQRKRYQRPNIKKEDQEQQPRSISNSASDYKQQLLTDRPKLVPTVASFTQRSTTVLNVSSQQALKKLMNINKNDFTNLIKDKALRQQLKKEEKRLTRIRTDQKFTELSQLQLSFLVINGLLSASEETITEYIKQKQPKPKTTARVNQEKQMTKQLAIVDDQISSNNFGSVKNTIQGLLKRFGKDEFLQGKVTYLTYLQSVIEELERQSNIFKDFTTYLQNLSSIEISSSENLLLSSNTLKNLKKQLNISLNKQSKKPEPNKRNVTYLRQFDKITTVLSAFIDPKPEKKPLKTEISVFKQIQSKNQGTQFLQEANKYLKQLLQKTSQDKQALYKQLQVLKKNKKKSIESPYNFVLKLYDIINSSKKEINDFNLYLKSLTQLNARKNLSSQNWTLQLKKIQQKFISNQVFTASKVNLDSIIGFLQDKQRLGQNSVALQQQIKKLKQENEKLSKTIEQNKGKIVEKAVEDQKVDKKKELQERRLKQAEKNKAEKFQKELEKSIENIFTNLSQKNYIIAKNAINVFIKKYQEMPNPTIPKSIQSFNAINTLITDLYAQETQNAEFDKREKTIQRQNEKQKQIINQKLKANEQYEGFLKTIVESFNEQKYTLKKYFDDLRRDRKKIIQQRYVLLLKLQDLISFWRSNKKNLENQNKSGTLDLSMTVVEGLKLKRELEDFQQRYRELQNKLTQTNKDVQQLLSLVKKIESGGQWWKFIPKNLRNNATFKPVYGILEQYRKYQLKIEALKTKQNLTKGETQAIYNAIDYINNLIEKEHTWISEEQWQKKLINFKGKQGYEKLVKFLRLFSINATLKMNEESQALKLQIERLERLNSDRQRSTSQLEQSATKRSSDLRSSRKSSRSRDKEIGKSKQILESYIEDQRNYLNRIDESEKEKQMIKQEMESTELKFRVLQQQLIKSEQRCHQLEIVKMELQKQKYKQFSQINNLKGQLQISEGRISQIQNKLEAQLAQYKNLYETVSKKMTQSASKTKKNENQKSSIKKETTVQGGQAGKQQSSQKKGGQKEVQKMQGIRYKINLDTPKVFELVDTDVNLREKARRRLQSMKNSGKKQQSFKKQEEVDSVSQQPTSSQINSELDLARQKQEYFISQNNRLLLMITDLTTENNSLKIQLQNLIATNNQNQSYLAQIQRLRRQIGQLTLMIQNLKNQHKYQIEDAIREAIKNQTDSFNAFHAQFLKEQENYFLNVVIPERIREQLSKIKIQSPIKSPQKSQSYVLDINSEQFLTLYNIKINQDYIDFQKRLEIQIKNHMSHFMSIELPILLENTRNEMRLQFDLVLQDEKKLRIQPQNSSGFIHLKEQYAQLCKEYEIFKKQKQNEVKLAVEAAVEKEVQNFNAFLANHQKEQENYYLNLVLPQKINEELIKRSPVKEQSYHLDINSQQFLHLYAIKSQNDKIMWQLIKADEWKAREIVITNYWLSLLEEKQKEWFFRYQRKIQTNQVKQTNVEIKLTEVQLMEIIRRRQYSNVLAILIQNARTEWQRTKQIEMINLKQSINIQWQNVIVPKIKSEWEVSKNEEIKVIIQNNQNKNTDVIIQQWKSMFLDSILEYERLNAITLFKQIQLPKLLSVQKERTQSTFKSLLQQKQRQWTLKYQELQASSSKRLQQQLQTKFIQNEFELRKTLQVQVRKSLELQLTVKDQSRTVQQNFSARLALELANWQKAKQQEIAKILEFQIGEWEKHKQNQITFILSNQRKNWEISKQKELEILINQQRTIWTQKQTEFFERRISQEKAKWRLVISQKDQELKNKNVNLDQLLKIRLIQMQKEYNQVRIPKILQAQYQMWAAQSQRNLELQRQIWLKNLPQLLTTETYSVYLDGYRQRFTLEYQQRTRSLELNLNNAERMIQQLTIELSQLNKKYLQINLQKEQSQQNLIKIRTQYNQAFMQINQTNHKLAQSGAFSKQNDDLKKIIARQNEQLKNIELLIKENSRLKQENLQLREAASGFENNKWREINQLRNQFQFKILELNSERTNLISRITQFETVRYASNSNQTIHSLERQIATLEATIRTKDTEIAFLKRAIDTNKDQLRQSRQQYAALFDMKSRLEKQFTEIKNKKLQIEYQIKFIAQREESLKKKLEMKEQEINALRKKQNFQTDLLEKKAKNSFEAIATYQLKITELESVFTLKNQECQAALIEVDRLRFQLQRSQANTHAVAHQLQTFKMRSRDIEAQLHHVRSQKERILEEFSKLKSSLNQHMIKEQDLNKQLINQSRMTKQTEGQRMRIQTQLQRLNNQIAQLLRDLSENQRIARRQSQKAVQLERQLIEVRSAARGVDPNQIEVLSKINNQVTQLTATNRQLTIKILLLENRDKISNFSSDLMNFFLLLQKHTDFLLDHLLKEAIIPNLEPYHRFLAESRPYLASGQLPMYFAKWETLLKQLFDISIKIRAEQLRSQAEQLLRLKEQMNEVLERQIEASESDAGQLVQDYKLVLMDIKSLVKEYVNSGDREYLSLLCSSLGVSLK